MGYVATKGGSQAILYAEELLDYFRLKGGSTPLTVNQIEDQLRLAVDRTMSEGSLYAPALAALALKQSEGDAIEASFLLRAYRSTVPRLAYSLPARSERMRLLRRISSTFKDIPGGQLLGPTRDYQLKLLNNWLLAETDQTVETILAKFEAQLAQVDPNLETGRFPKVIESMRQQGILAPAQPNPEPEPYDITRKAISFPAPRSARLQTLARADTGSVLALAYSSVRGYGDAHPTLGELRVGYLPVEVAHPVTGEAVEIGEILVTECEMVSRVTASPSGSEKDDSLPQFGLGYGFSFGHSEIKTISMAILDRVLSAAKEVGVHGKSGPAADEEFVLQHVDGIEASGFTAHFKLPHYVTFQADITGLERNRYFEATLREEADQRREVIKASYKLGPLGPQADDDEEED